MSNIGGINSLGVNSDVSFDVVAEARRLGDINSYAVNNNEAINGSSFIASALTPTVVRIEQNVAYLIVNTVVIDIVQQVLLRFAGGGLDTAIILIEQSVAYLKETQSVIDIENTVIDP